MIDVKVHNGHVVPITKSIANDKLPIVGHRSHDRRQSERCSHDEQRLYPPLQVHEPSTAPLHDGLLQARRRPAPPTIG